MSYIGREPTLAVLERIGPFTGDGTTSTFALPQPPGNAEALLVVEGGVVQQPGASYEISGSNLNFIDSNGDPRAPANGVEIFGLYRGLDVSRKALGTAAQRQIGSNDSDLSPNELVVNQTSKTGSAELPVGTTGERDGSPEAGYLRFNSSTNLFEGYSGTEWTSVGGSEISNDTSTSTDVFPLFADATSGVATDVFTSDSNLLYQPNTGELKVKKPVAKNGIFANARTITEDTTIDSDENAMSAGPVDVASGVTVTVETGARWVIV